MSYSCVNLLLTLRIVEVNIGRLRKSREECETNVLNFYHNIYCDLFRNPIVLIFYNRANFVLVVQLEAYYSFIKLINTSNLFQT